MPRNGSGVYSVPAGTKGAPNTTIESAKYNAFIDDIVGDLNTNRWGFAVYSGAAIYRTTKAVLDADLAHDADTVGVVWQDSTAANNGIYTKSGASGAGSWTQVLNYIPGHQFVSGTDDGNSTANAITMDTVPYAISASGASLISFIIPVTNTSTTVTVAFNGGAAYTIKTAAGNSPSVGGLVTGMAVLGIISGSEFQLRSDQTGAAIQAAAENAQSYAEEWANKAEDSLISIAAGGDGLTKYSSLHWAAKAEGFKDDAEAAATLLTNRLFTVADKTALKAVDNTSYTYVALAKPNITGSYNPHFISMYKWRSDVPIATHQADTYEVMYIAPNAAADGAWVRQFWGDEGLTPFDFGAEGNATLGTSGTGTDDTDAIRALMSVPYKKCIPDGYTFRTTGAIYMYRSRDRISGAGYIQADHSDFALRCSGTGDTDYSYRVNQLRIHGVGTASGILLNGTLNALVNGCTIEECVTGVSATNASAHGSSILENDIQATDIANSIGISISHNDAYITNNRINGCYDGIVLAGSAILMRGNHTYRSPSTSFRYGVRISSGTVISVINSNQNYWDSPGTNTGAFWYVDAEKTSHLKIHNDTFLQNQTTDRPFLLTFGPNPTVINEWDIVGNVFYKSGTAMTSVPFSWDTDIDLTTTSTSTLRVFDNAFENCVPAYTRGNRTSAITTGNTFKNESFVYLIGSAGYAHVSGFNGLIGITFPSAKTIKSEIPSAAASDIPIYLSIRSKCDINGEYA